MPAPQERPQPRGRGFRLVTLGDQIQVHGDRRLCYFTTTPIFGDAGEVYLEGQGGTELVSTPGRVAFTIRDGRLITGDYRAFARQGLFDITVGFRPGVREVRGYRQVVTMEIDGIDTTFTSTFEHGDDIIEEKGRKYVKFSYTGEAWSSNNPQDQNAYIFMASPEDIALLSSLSFSFKLIPSE